MGYHLSITVCYVCTNNERRTAEKMCQTGTEKERERERYARMRVWNIADLFMGSSTFRKEFVAVEEMW